MSIIYYAAYGSNINLDQMAFRCPNSKVVGVGYIPGYQLYFDIHADIERSDNPDNRVPVLLWEIAEEDWEKLDIYEGFPKYYITKIVPVVYKGKKTQAIAYVMNKKYGGGYSFPNEKYFDTIVEGYIDNGIEEFYLLDAIDYTAVRMIDSFMDFRNNYYYEDDDDYEK